MTTEQLLMPPSTLSAVPYLLISIYLLSVSNTTYAVNTDRSKTDKVDIDDVPDYLNVVPSVLEAFDMIEMDEIERDLGF